MVIREDRGGNYDAAYLMLIPTKRYYNLNSKNILADYLKGPGFHGDFTGRVTFHPISNFSLMAVNQVE